MPEPKPTTSPEINQLWMDYWNLKGPRPMESTYFSGTPTPVKATPTDMTPLARQYWDNYWLSGGSRQDWINQMWMDYWNGKGPRPMENTTFTGSPSSLPPQPARGLASAQYAPGTQPALIPPTYLRNLPEKITMPTLPPTNPMDDFYQRAVAQNRPAQPALAPRPAQPAPVPRPALPTFEEPYNKFTPTPIPPRILAPKSTMEDYYQRAVAQNRLEPKRPLRR